MAKMRYAVRVEFRQITGQTQRVLHQKDFHYSEPWTSQEKYDKAVRCLTEKKPKKKGKTG
jgi:hypothetical protein